MITFYLPVHSLKRILTQFGVTYIRSNQTVGIHIAGLGLDRQQKIMFLVGSLSPPFDHETTTLTKRVMSSAISKIYKLCAKKLLELEAP